jgi:hypothetical protein
MTYVFFVNCRSNHFYSITSDHWTSAANENYGALTLHVIHDVELKSFVMSCVHYEKGKSAFELESQLVYDLDVWGLDKKHFFVVLLIPLLI